MKKACPICETENDKAIRICHICGFDDLHREFINKEDGDYWFETVVKPHRVQWEAKKREAELLTQIERLEVEFGELETIKDEMSRLRQQNSNLEANLRNAENETNKLRQQQATIPEATTNTQGESQNKSTVKVYLLDAFICLILPIAVDSLFHFLLSVLANSESEALTVVLSIVFNFLLLLTVVGVFALFGEVWGAVKDGEWLLLIFPTAAAAILGILILLRMGFAMLAPEPALWHTWPWTWGA